MSNSTIVASSPLNSGSHSHMSSNSSSVIHSNAVGNSVLSSSSSPMLTASGTSDAISQCHNILNMLQSQPNAAKTEANTSSAYMDKSTLRMIGKGGLFRGLYVFDG
ncbi:putative protein TPRXL [Momordica charantia]|uniref:Uncharacterized protein n=1 Tax=Momordica charantia TaxID=3673 RepID=A0A6J1DD16_MOMCH|nr:putative protein TPRXL [Momordica charantia]